MKPTGLYIHIPFCKSKCSYCDFYSVCDFSLMNDYVTAVIREMENFPARECDTLYIGGGTPTLLGAELLHKLISAAKNRFRVEGEITLEANPADDLKEILKICAADGVNRLSLGVQSGNENELKILSRRHTNDDVIRTVNAAKSVGIRNISLDLMLGIPEQTPDNLLKSLDFICGFDPKHVSAYMLTLEENTPLYKNRDKYVFPDENAVCELYLKTVEILKKRGYGQYEISNFSADGFQSRHNLKYWNCDEYIGIGASAHGFIDGVRYKYGRNVLKFIEMPEKTITSSGGDKEEYIMLRLRLKDGLIFSDYEARYGEKIPPKILETAALLSKNGLCDTDRNHISLTERGFLVSNEITAKFLS